MKKKNYRSIMVSRLTLDTSMPVLAASIVIESTIQTTGQEIGASYDFTQDPTTGEDAGKHFNHEWE